MSCRPLTLLPLLVALPLLVSAQLTFNWDDLEIPTIHNYINYSTDAYERNFSKYFHHNTMKLDTDQFTLDPSSSTMSMAEERPVLEKVCTRRLLKTRGVDEVLMGEFKFVC